MRAHGRDAGVEANCLVVRPQKRERQEEEAGGGAQTCMRACIACAMHGYALPAVHRACTRAVYCAMVCIVQCIPARVHA